MNIDKIVIDQQQPATSNKPNVIRRKHHAHNTVTNPRPASPSYRVSTIPCSPTSPSSPKPVAAQAKQPQQTLSVSGPPAAFSVRTQEEKKSSHTGVEHTLSAEEKELERLLKGEELENEQLLPLHASGPPDIESSPRTHPLLLEVSDMQQHLSQTRSNLWNELDQYPLLVTSLTPPVSLSTPLPVHNPTSSLVGAKTADHALKLRPRSRSTIHNDALHNIPIARMGDYQAFLRQHPWPRDPFEDSQDFNAFGSPYKLGSPFRLRPKSPTPVPVNSSSTASATTANTAAAAPAAKASTALPVADIPAVTVEDKPVDEAVEHVDELADVMDATPNKHQIHQQQGWQERQGMSLQNGNKRPNLFEWVENRKKDRKQQQQIQAEVVATSSTTTLPDIPTVS